MSDPKSPGEDFLDALRGVLEEHATGDPLAEEARRAIVYGSTWAAMSPGARAIFAAAALRFLSE